MVAEDVMGSFILFIFSTEVVIHKEYASCQTRISETLANKWSKPYSQIIIEWIRVLSQLSIIWASSLHVNEERGIVTLHL